MLIEQDAKQSQLRPTHLRKVVTSLSVVNAAVEKSDRLLESAFLASKIRAYLSGLADDERTISVGATVKCCRRCAELPYPPTCFGQH